MTIDRKNIHQHAVNILAATQFLSRLPVWRIEKWLNCEMNNPGFSVTARYFPIAGFIIALPSILILVLSSVLGIPPLANALLVIATLIMTTGALHEDGLADVADGFGGGTSIEKKLMIMRDSTIGTYAACALILSIGMRIVAIYLLIQMMGILSTTLILVTASMVSRASILWPWTALPSARENDGLSTEHGNPNISDFKFTAILVLILSVVVLIPLFGLSKTLIILFFTALSVAAFTKFCQEQISGHTGDTLGATQQIAEIAFLIAAISGI